MEDFLSKLKQFSKLDLQSQQEVINEGRPTPELKGLLQTTQKISRSFQTEWYTRKEWLCGCAARSRLFCYPCLLFSPSDNVWTQAGYGDMKNLQRSLSKHERSATHIQSQISLKTFGTSRIDLALDERRRLNIHNAKVKENREALKDLINATCFLAKQQLALGGGDGSTGSAHRGNVVELLHAFAEKDDRLARHLETSTVFSGWSDRMQDDLIEAISDVITNDIRKEISAAPFVAVEVDETTGVTHAAQVSVILRYVAETEADCRVKEAFLGFDDVGADRRAPAVAEYVLGVLEKYNCVDKLVAQSYDGAAVLASELNGVQARIKEKVPQAMFTHCCAHKLNLVLLHSARCVPESRAFLKTAEGLGAFFSKSARRTRLLDDVVMAPTRWSSNSRLLQTISMHHNDLRALFHMIMEDPESWDNETLMMAAGYDLWLSQAWTCFLLMAYERILTETEALFRVLQNKVMDIECCLTRIRNTVAALGRMRLEFDSFYEQFEQRSGTLGLTESGSRVGQSVREKRRQALCSILDNISDQMEARFDHFGELAFLGLVDCSKFSEMSQRFDETKLQSLSKYAKFFDFVRLKADLIGLYRSQTVRDECKSPGQLLNFLAHKDLIQTVPEATKLLQLVLTVPATTASVEGSSSALKRIKSYSRNRTDQGRLSSLAVISIEMERLLKLRQDRDDFYKKVTDIFVQKDQRVEFILQVMGLNESINMDTMKIEQVVVGNEVSSAAVEIKPEPVVVPLQPSQDESLQCFQCLITFSDSKVKEKHIKNFHEDQDKQHLPQCLNESISMDTVKIEPVIVGSEVSSTSVDIKPDPAVSPLQSSEDESLQCFQCLITFSNLKVKERHIKKFHGDQYKQHLQQKNTLFTCYRCDKCFFTSEELSQHQATHSREEKPFCCGYCRKEFCTFSELYKHRREECTECIERRCPCKDCGALFPNSERLLNHRIAMHPEFLVVVKDTNAYQCSKCNQCYQTEDDLVKHQENLACNINHGATLQGKKRSLNPQNDAHFEVVAEKKIKEEETHDWEAYSDSTATEGCPYNEPKIELKIPCSETGCDFLFPSVEALRAHKKKIHGRPHKTHACTECDQRYTRLEQLSAHMASVHHSGYTCNTCGKCFAQESILDTHQKTHRNKAEVAEQR